MNQETKVGVFLIAALSAILTSALFLGKVDIFHRSDRYFVEFKDVEALPRKAAVKIAGVEIGTVRQVALVGGKARVTIDINRGIPIYSDAKVSIGSTGIIGTKFVEIRPGGQGEKFEPGAVLQGASGGSLSDMIQKVSAFFEEDPEHGNAVDNLKESIAHIRNVTRALDQAMGQHASDMEQIVLNIRDLTKSIKVFSAHLQEISTEKKDDVKVAIGKIRSISEKVDEMMDRIKGGKGAIGALVSDDKTGQDVREAVASLKDTAASAKKVLGRFTQINTYWNYRYRYDTRDEESRSDVAITFVPRPGKFYSIGATNVGDPETNEPHVAYERKNRIMAVLGQDYGPFTGYVGAIRSRGGVGLNFRPFFWSPKLNRRFELNAEAFDFSRDRVVRGRKLEGTNLSFGAHAAITRWFWLGVRSEDVLDRAAFMTYANIVFRDEDLAYLLGFASFAK